MVFLTRFFSKEIKREIAIPFEEGVLVNASCEACAQLWGYKNTDHPEGWRKQLMTCFRSVVV
jgi:hypothetical protein